MKKSTFNLLVTEILILGSIIALVIFEEIKPINWILWASMFMIGLFFYYITEVYARKREK